MMSARAGSALVLLGLIALIVFVIMLTAGTTDLLLLLGASALTALGLLLRRRAARLEDRHGPGRFHTARRLLGRDQPEERLDREAE